MRGYTNDRKYADSLDSADNKGERRWRYENSFLAQTLHHKKNFQGLEISELQHLIVNRVIYMCIHIYIHRADCAKVKRL